MEVVIKHGQKVYLILVIMLIAISFIRLRIVTNRDQKVYLIPVMKLIPGSFIPEPTIR